MEANNINKKTRKRVGFNAVDFLLVVIILALVAAAVYAYLPGMLDSSPDNGTVEYTVVFESTEPGAFASVQSGDSVMCGSFDFGQVVSVVTEPAYFYTFASSSATVVRYTDASASRVTVKISAEADISENGYKVDGRTVAAGLEYTLSFPTYTGECRCISAVAGGKQ